MRDSTDEEIIISVEEKKLESRRTNIFLIGIVISAILFFVSWPTAIICISLTLIIAVVMGEKTITNEFGEKEKLSKIIARRKKNANAITNKQIRQDDLKNNRKENTKVLNSSPVEAKPKLFTANKSESFIQESLRDKKDTSIEISASDVDALAAKFPSQKFYLQAPIILKIEAVPRYKAYMTVMDYLGEHWAVENVTDPDTDIIYHVLRVKVSDMYHKSRLAQALIPLSRVIKVQYRGTDYPVSDFKNAIYQYSEGFIAKLEDVLGEKKVWEPQNKPLNNNSSVIIPNKLDFVAIDFETANNKRSSACSIGVVLVKDGVIAEKIHRLINPGSIEWGAMNIAIHGIKPDTVKASPTFPEVWKELSPYFQTYPIIAHNAASFDISVLRACLLENGITPPEMKFGCTMEAAKNLGWSSKLKDLCKEKGIKLEHHNALSDAEACALIAISIYNETESFSNILIREFKY